MRYHQNRREFLASAAAGAGIAMVGLNTGTATEAKPVILTARPGSAPLATGIKGATPTSIWGYNGQTPGPELRCRAGERLSVRLDNRLDQATSIHWHGVRIDNAMDGVPGLTQKAVAPGKSFDYDFVAPDAGTYWYHTHNRSWEQQARGLYGVLVVEETDPPGFDRDMSLVIDDWRLRPDGQIDAKSFGDLHDWAHQGRLGNWLTVNGVSKPDLPVVAGERIRLRLVNVANARVFSVSLPGDDVYLVALDGRPVPPRPVGGKPLVLAPAQRADLAFRATGKPGDIVDLKEVTYDKPYSFARIVYQTGTHRPERSAAFPPALPDRTDALDLATASRHDLIMTGGAMGGMARAMHQGRMMETRELMAAKKVWAFNGVAGDLDKPLLETARGRTVIINMINDTQWPHAMHLHGHHFKVVERNGRPVRTAPWRDTVLMQRREKLAIAFKADNPGKWLLHCHMVEHMAGGMVTWFRIGA